MNDNPTGMRKGLTRYGDQAFSQYLRNVFLRGMGYSKEATDKPVVGIVNTFSDFNACHRTVPDLVKAVKRGVMMAGGMPMEFPVISLHESFSYPTSMLLRNLMAMDVEEMIRAQPMDAVVLIGGCDKTVPALLMGAISANLPSILLVTGPAMTGSHQGERVGACTDCRRFWVDYRAGNRDEQEIQDVTGQLMPTAGTCSVMGTASTMACLAEAMGMMLPGGASAPAVSSERLRLAEATGNRAMEMIGERLTPRKIISLSSLRNALRMLQATGGSTNAVVHLAAIARRAGLKLDLEALNEAGDRTPMLVDLKPSGQHYMEDLHRAGGVPGIMRKLADRFELDCLTVSGKSHSENLTDLKLDFDQDIIRDVAKPLFPGNALVALKGNLAPHGAVIKTSSATSDLLTHTGRAVVFDSLDDLAARIDDPALEIKADDILVLRNAGPVGAPGMPEAGFVPIPKYLLQQGVKDMVRISDARMSGTAFGTTVLHVSPESA
ncbi:MAG: dihydroxy-acid dehydratase, partial [Verrucomicrobiae bacterium]|nr:dihydroxy-acid dehydratase [Verrucomicrobiae bacterium]